MLGKSAFYVKQSDRVMGVRQKWKSSPIFNWQIVNYTEKQIIQRVSRAIHLQNWYVTGNSFLICVWNSEKSVGRYKTIHQFHRKNKTTTTTKTDVSHTIHWNLRQEQTKKRNAFVRPKHTGILRVSGQTFS